MTRRKAIGDTKSGRLVYEVLRYTEAEVTRVIDACARQAVNFPRPCTSAQLRAAVIAAGRKAAGRGK